MAERRTARTAVLKSVLSDIRSDDAEKRAKAFSEMAEDPAFRTVDLAFARVLAHPPTAR